GKKELEDIYYKYAYSYYYLKQYISSAYYFKNFSSTFPNSPYREEVDFMSAYSNYKMSPTFRLDQSYTLTAIDELQIFANTYPDSDRVQQANGLIDELRLKLEEKAFRQGELYYNTRQYQAAVQTLENLLKDFPDTQRADEIRYFIIRATFDLAENSVIDKQKERYETVEKRSTKFLKRYGRSAFRNEVNVINKKSIQKLKNIKQDDRYKVKSTVFGSQLGSS
ncbi:MAG: outer membrane protein assembly factor BamD, partial [Bacteroidota bacterium]